MNDYHKSIHNLSNSLRKIDGILNKGKNIVFSGFFRQFLRKKIKIAGILLKA